MHGAAPGSTDALSLRTARGRRTMIPIMLAAMQNPLNSSLIVTALIPIGLEFHVGPLQTSWLISGLYLSSAVGQTVMGKLVDALGARRVLLAGLMISLCAASLGALAPSLAWLIAARVLLGVGNSAGFPAAMSILRRINGEGAPVPTNAISLLTIAAQVSVSAGPALSGIIVVLFGWRAIFSLNLPICVLTAVLVLVCLPPDPRRTRTDARTVLADLDVPGIVLFALAMTMLMFAVQPFALRGAVLAAGLLCALGFVVRELRVARPFIDLGLIGRTRGLGRTIARQAVNMGVIYTFFYATAEWLQDAHRAPAAVVGLMNIPNATISIGAAATLGRTLSPRSGLIAGSVAGLAAVSLTFGWNAASSYLLIAVALGCAGAHSGLVGVSSQSILYAQTPAGYVGLTAGIFRTTQYVGGIIAATLMGLAFGSHAGDAGLHTIMLGLGTACALMIVVGVIDRTIPDRAKSAT
jgi:MFS family permease